MECAPVSVVGVIAAPLDGAPFSGGEKVIVAAPPPDVVTSAVSEYGCAAPLGVVPPPTTVNVEPLVSTLVAPAPATTSVVAPIAGVPLTVGVPQSAIAVKVTFVGTACDSYGCTPTT